MKIEIEKYRGWDISFDTNKELFDGLSDFYDKQEYKKSLTGVRKWVDDFIKDNTNFIPFYIQMPSSMYADEKKVYVVGIRKDGRFLIERNGKKEQLSPYYEKDYILFHPENQPILQQCRELDSEIEIIRQRKVELLKTLMKGKILDEIRKEYIQQPQTA